VSPTSRCWCLTLGGWCQGDQDAVPFREVEGDLTELLRRFGPAPLPHGQGQTLLREGRQPLRLDESCPVRHEAALQGVELDRGTARATCRPNSASNGDGAWRASQRGTIRRFCPSHPDQAARRPEASSRRASPARRALDLGRIAGCPAGRCAGAPGAATACAAARRLRPAPFGSQVGGQVFGHGCVSFGCSSAFEGTPVHWMDGCEITS